MTMTHPRQAGRIGQGQLIAMAAIVLAGLAAAAHVLHSEGHTPAATGHANPTGAHGDGQDHSHVHGTNKGANKGVDQGDDHGPGHAPEAKAGQVAFTDAQVSSAGIVIEAANASRVRTTVQMPGEIRFNADRTAHVVPRVAGVVERVLVDLGQQVRQGQVLAVVSSATLSDLRSEWQATQKRLALARTTHDREKKLFEDKISAQMDFLQAQQALREAEIAAANAGHKLQALGAAPNGGVLSRYELRAPFDGMVVEKHLALGEAVKEDTNVFTLSDLSTVWAEISVPAKDLVLLRVGDQVSVRSSAFEGAAAGRVAFVSALIGEQTRTATARVVLANPQLSWRPGLYVNVEVTAAEVEAPVTVSTQAIQSLDGREVVFVATPDGFTPRTVKPGRSDGRRTEILSGLQAGERHAAANSFVVKAELGKATAEHVH